MQRRDTVGLQPLPLRGEDDAIRNESGQRRFVEMLQLTPAASTEMPARRRGTMWTGFYCAIGKNAVARRGKRHMPATGRHAVTFRGDANYFLKFAPKQDSYASEI